LLFLARVSFLNLPVERLKWRWKLFPKIEYIKPSSPTPPNRLKTHKHSLDQFVPNVYVPIILFYPMNQSTDHSVDDIVSQRSQLLKQSLSETLARFYPFARKVKDSSLSIDCNDEGVYYTEASVNCHLVECLNQPNTALFYRFLRGEALGKELTAGDHVAMIQVSTRGLYMWRYCHWCPCFPHDRQWNCH
jgi:shikimate O-hydroxycinnamoyltransferase